MSPKKEKAWVFASIVAGFTILIIVVCGEIGLRFVLRQGLVTAIQPTNRYIFLREYRPDQILEIQPTYRYVSESDGLTAKRVRLAVDGDGFIGGAQRYETPDGTIAFLGGSTTECLYLDEDKRFPSVVASLLGEKRGWHVRAINAGTSGGNALHSINKLINVVAPKKPQVVVFMHAINDLTTLAYFGSYWNADRRGNLVVIEYGEGSFPYMLKLFAKRYVPGYFSMAMVVSDYLNQKVDDEFVFDREMFNANLQREERLVNLFSQQLVLFVHVTRAIGATPVLMTQANRIENNDPFVRDLFRRTRPGLDYDRWVKVYARFNEEIRRVAAIEHIDLVDLARTIPGTKEYAYDPVHLTERGSVAVAGEIVKILDRVVPDTKR
ncbi:MAG: SGNH/GDSL hydrolase family protein [Nitrospira sp.]|nr:SGNH/GDSL hydrolase family protein [Nitrospira sp.]